MNIYWQNINHKPLWYTVLNILAQINQIDLIKLIRSCCKMYRLETSKCVNNLFSKLQLCRFITSGPQGVEGRLPRRQNLLENGSPIDLQNAPTITDPYVLYQNYISLGTLEKDENQVRVMKEFQKLYHRVINYVPSQDMQIKMSLVLRKLEIQMAKERQAERERGLKRMAYKLVNLSDSKRVSSQVIRFLTDEEELQNFPSPQGLLVNGEVGCGKSMLMDIFASSLPHASKMRWHYNNFILWIYSEIHNIQQERFLRANNGLEGNYTMENEFILFEIAQKMIKKNTILMLDEFMLPDIASANIVKILFTYYFKLGGVLVATSNKLPDDLYGSQFHKDNFKTFVLILHARCQTIDMNSSKDYRHNFALSSQKELHLMIKGKLGDEEAWINLVKSQALKISTSDSQFAETVNLEQLKPQKSVLKVYNRDLILSTTFGQVCVVDFSHICQGLFSSSDYITIASKFHTIVLDNIPVMTTKMKNEARHFITLLDAAYEAKCQLFLRCDAPLDELFFPDAVDKAVSDRIEVQEEEMFAKTAIDLSSPYRPNALKYDQHYTEEYKENETQRYDFKNATAFTGDDEKFAYKRAILRIREMVDSESWRNVTWVPIDSSMRPWETQAAAMHPASSTTSSNNVLQVEMERRSAKDIVSEGLPREISQGYGLSFRNFNALIAPVFTSMQHFWGWGRPGRNVKDDIAKRWAGRDK